MEDTFVIDALERGLNNRQPEASLTAHSARAYQYVFDGLRPLMDVNQIHQSMSRAENPYDNAFAELF